MKNYKHSGEKINITAGADLVSGQVLKVSDVIGVIGNGVSSGETAVLNRKGCYEVAKLSTDVVAQGDSLYWDDTNKEMTLDNTGNTLAGYADQTAGNGETTVRIILA